MFEILLTGVTRYVVNDNDNDNDDDDDDDNDNNRIYNKILDRDWFSARLFVT